MDFFEEYRKIAKDQGFEFDSAENQRLLLNPYNSSLKRNFCYLSKGDSIYFASDSYSNTVNTTSRYSGIYTAIPFHINDFEAEITKRFWFDSITGGKRIKTNNSFIDKHISIKSNKRDLILLMIDAKLTELYLKLWDKYPPLKLVYGVKGIPAFNEFENKLVLGVELNTWIFPQKFEKQFNDINELIGNMKQRIEKSF